MIYLTPPASDIERIYANPFLGTIVTPTTYRPKPHRWCACVPIKTDRYDIGRFKHWAIDNGCFSGLGFDPDKYIYFLLQMKVHISTCLFATAPDIVGDHEKTWELAKHWLGCIKSIGYPPAFIAQDGFDGSQPIDWSMFDWLFVGGTTEYKLGPDAKKAIIKAKEMGKKVHVGRVNSLRRAKIFNPLGVDSVDGTCIIYGPDIYLAKIENWMKILNNVPD